MSHPFEEFMLGLAAPTARPLLVQLLSRDEQLTATLSESPYRRDGFSQLVISARPTGQAGELAPPPEMMILKARMLNGRQELVAEVQLRDVAHGHDWRQLAKALGEPGYKQGVYVPPWMIMLVRQGAGMANFANIFTARLVPEDV